jgi:hypothetical protein
VFIFIPVVGGVLSLIVQFRSVKKNGRVGVSVIKKGANANGNPKHAQANAQANMNANPNANSNANANTNANANANSKMSDNFGVSDSMTNIAAAKLLLSDRAFLSLTLTTFWLAVLILLVIFLERVNLVFFFLAYSTGIFLIEMRME